MWSNWNSYIVDESEQPQLYLKYSLAVSTKINIYLTHDSALLQL